ncbi:peptide ABC transporter substrate-binding protein [Salmonella enterica subsp. enterica]|nr:peptide ABC transporter substrate-binding protein [Salmonella enterica subsp. enterica]
MRLVLSSLIVIAGLLSSQATAATAPEQTASADIRDSGFVYCVSGQVNTFNPQKASSGLIVDTLAAQLYDRLLDVDPYTYRLVPELAESWEVLDNGATYRFHLRRDVSFQKPPGLRRPENSTLMMSSLPFSGFSIVGIRGITSTAVASPTLIAYSSPTM